MKSLSLIWTDRAVSDLLRIKSYIACDNPHASMEFTKRLKKSAERLEKFPLSGRTVPELSRNEIREVIVDNYRIIYKMTPKKIFVLTVFESHRKFKLKRQD